MSGKAHAYRPRLLAILRCFSSAAGVNRSLSKDARASWVPQSWSCEAQESNGCSHVDRVLWLLQTVVRNDVCFHWVVSVSVLGIHELSNARGARPVDFVLVLFLQLMSRVAEHFAIFGLLRILGLGEACVEHVLVVLDDGGVPAELVIESVLGVRQDVPLVPGRGHVRLVSVRLRTQVILSQVRVERTLAVGWSVVGAQATGAIRDVSVPAAAVVHVNDGLRVNVSQVVLGALLQECKGT